MTVMCLDENMVNQDNILKQAYDNLDFSKLQDDITHFVELFGSVDRRQMGSISTESLQGILSTALDQEIKDSTYKQILYDLGKDQNSSIDKMEFLADIPYFLTYRN
ncbi:uncharacterized protein LOC102804975 [Saccoglossus kowalevskii]|uniref:Uncharacterized protein LOC102804975 n=1 Tax=Saccoglossus kowalevskii TaxID=10224 RepID=A0ABM0MJ91_SACKO|nr:PREDICTED: uncharacterized protein LOC102804975 [Saccoglossus kowalevskii]